MITIDCHVCGATAPLFQAEGWLRSLDDKWLCPGKHNAAVGRASWETSVIEPDDVDTAPPEENPPWTNTPPLPDPPVARLGERAPPEVLGFDRPEDGSEKRYRERRTKRPWGAHTFWWVVHNAVAHPLIAVFPKRRFFQFHDWTSRKMHGV